MSKPTRLSWGKRGYTVKKNKKQIGLKTINMLKYSLIIGYAVIVILAVITVAALAFRTADRALKEQVTSLVSSLNVQMKLNLESYLSRMETIATLAFASEETYQYDATVPHNDEYEAVVMEKTISDKLFGLCIMENFVDYAIIYRNNHAVGKLSNGTVNQFGDTIFQDLESIITRQRTNDGWAAGFDGNFKRIYYVKSIHENALLVISFYADELANVFDNPETMSEMSIRLLNEDYAVLYSSETGEVGNFLPDDIASRIRQKNDVTLMDDKYLVTVNSCGESWYVVCSIPAEFFLQKQRDVRQIILLAAVVAALLAVLIGMVFAVQLTRPVESFVTVLDFKAHNDQLTGILNKLSFEELTKNKLETEPPTVPHALILLDVDNFKGVNDTLGHTYGDEVLARIGSNLRAIFSTEDYVGRIGGDEFCVFVNTKPPENMEYTDYIRTKCEMICAAFHEHYTGADGKYKISGSIGCAFFSRDGEDFKTLYAAADNALYASKHKGKDTYTIIGGEGTDHA